MSQPQRLVLELLLQEAVPDKLDTTNHERLVKRLVDKGLAPADHPRVAAALAALQSTGSAEEPPQLERRLPDANPDDLTEESPETSASDDNPSDNDAINFDSLLSGFNSEGVLEEDAEDQTRLTSNHEDLEKALRDTNASPVVNLVNRILLQALQLGASDIHVEPQQIGLQVRFRQDGVLQSYSEPLPSRLVPAVTSRFKIMADLDIAERRQAQDGRIRRRFRDRTVDFRVNSLPSRFGEKIVLRLLDSSSTQLGLDKLITNPEALELVRALGSKPFGMILVTGPTGSGKSTTLYSLLAERNDPGINISTVEDPIEYTLPGITQCQVNREKGFDFSTALRAFMRQDPDVLLVGETRDLETAKTAIEAALNGSDDRRPDGAAGEGGGQ